MVLVAIQSGIGPEGSLRSDKPARMAAAPEPSANAPASPAELAEDEEDAMLGSDQDDMRSLLQPAISPVATRLASPRTPAAEKAAAMEALDGFLDPLPGRSTGDIGGAQPSISSVLLAGPSSSAAVPVDESPVLGTVTYDVPHISTSGADGVAQFPQFDARPDTRQQQTEQPPQNVTKQSALSGVFGDGGRHRRSSSVGTDALKKRLSKAIPTLTLPSGLFTNISMSPFFSMPSPSSTPSPNQGATSASNPSATLPDVSPSSAQRATRPEIRFAQAIEDALRRSSVASGAESHALRRSTSADSLLYTTLSRVSSLGDDGRFSSVRGQVNARFKAIIDSFDRPSFKMPQLQLPSMIPAPLKKSLVPGDANTGARPKPTVESGPPAVVAQIKDGAAMLDTVLQDLCGDIVMLGGYRGSVLRSRKRNEMLWVPVKVGLGIRRVDLSVGLDEADEESMPERIYASGMLTHIGPVDIARRLLRKVRESPNARAGKLRVHEFAYDWRLSPARASRQLIRFLESLPCNKVAAEGRRGSGAIVLAHSLGGLVTRHAVNRAPHLFSGVVYCGTPQSCISILGPLRNDDKVLINEKVLTAAVSFSFRSSFALLPEDGFCFMSKDGKKTFPIDFYDPENWFRYKLSPCCDLTTTSASASASGSIVKRNSAIDTLRDLSSSWSSLPLRSRSGSDARALGQARNRSRSRSKSRPRSRQSNGSRNVSPDPIPSGSSSTPPPSSPPLTPPAINRGRIFDYLTRTLAQTKQFRTEAGFRQELAEANAYPPFAVIFGKNTPTVYGARVSGPEAISSDSCFDDLVFGSGDGVVTSREAMLPPGYEVVRGGMISTEKGHISILGDFSAVARALQAIVKGRNKGIGLGNPGSEATAAK